MYKKLFSILFVVLFLFGCFAGYSIALAGTLTATNVEPASLAAGTTNQVTVNFTTIGVIPPGGKVKVTFGSGFNVAGANGGICPTFLGDGGISGFSTTVAGQIVTIARVAGTATVAAHAETCTINGIVNPVSAGSTGTYTITTTDPSNVLIDNNVAVTADVITSAATANVSFTLTTPAENGTTNHLTGGGATYSVNADVANGTTSVVITGTKTAGQTVVVAGFEAPPRDDSLNVVVGGTDTASTYTVNTVTNGLPGPNGPGDNVSLTGGNKTFSLTVSEAGKSDIVYNVNVQVAAPAAIVVPTLTTEDTATEIKKTTATISGAIIDLGGENAFERGFKYGLTLEYENYTTQTGSYGATEFTADLTNLSCSKTYHYQNYASNSAGTGYGLDQTFKTSSCASSGGGSFPTFTPTIPATQSEECKSGDLFSTTTGKLCSTSPAISLPTPISCPISIYGSTNELVKEKTRGINAKGVQNAINQIKAITPPLIIDSIIGSLSETGIKNAQKILLVTLDGIWGPITQQAYELFIKKQCSAF